MRNLGIVVIILVLAALGWFLLQGQGNEPTVVEAPAAVEVPAVEVEEVVEEAAEAVDAVETAVEGAVEAANEAIDEASTAVNEAVSEALEEGSAVAEAVSGAVNNLTEQAQDAVEGVADDATGAASEAPEAATEAATETATEATQAPAFDAAALRAQVDGSDLGALTKTTLNAAIGSAESNPELVQGVLDQISEALGN